MKKLAVGLLLSMVSVSAFANTPTFKTLADEKATFELCKNMANAVNTETMDFQPIADIARPYWKFGDTDPNLSFTVLVHQSNKIAQNRVEFWGKPLNVVFVETNKDKLGYFIRHNFMIRRENIGLFFYCEFYKNDTGWNFLGVRYNDIYANFFK